MKALYFKSFPENGTAFIELDGSVKEIDLAAGEKLKVDTGSVAIF